MPIVTKFNIESSGQEEKKKKYNRSGHMINMIITHIYDKTL